MGRSTAKTIVDWIASIAMIAVASTIVAERVLSRGAADAGRPVDALPRDPIPKEPITVRDSARIGSPRASTAAILFLDFQCPYSRKFAVDVWPRFYSQYVESGKVLFSFHHLPLPIHRDAFEAAVGAECAGQQRKLLAMQDLLFKVPADLSADRVRGFGDSLPIDRDRFDECFAGSGRETVNQDVEAAAEWGVRTTPTIFLGAIEPSQRVRVDMRLDGLPTFERLARILERRYGI